MYVCIVFGIVMQSGEEARGPVHVLSKRSVEGKLVSGCFEPSQAQRITSGLCRRQKTGQ